MKLEEFYACVGGDYEEVKERLVTEERIEKYLNKFIEAKDYEELTAAMEAKDWGLAFRMSHNLKGMCSNLGICSLFEVSSRLCETMRNGEPKEDNSNLFVLVKEEYHRTVNLIKEVI